MTCTFTSGVITLTACLPGYVFVAATTTPVAAAYCVACGTYASTCTVAAGVVTNTACLTGYYLSSGACYAFTTGVTAASAYAAGVFTATTCATGYYLSGTTCTACGAGQYSCASATTSIVCANGYYATSATVCTAYSIAALTNCAYGTPASATTSPTACLVCKIGYALGTTNLCTACVDTNAATCVQLSATTSFSTSCKFGYFLANGVCKATATGQYPWTAAATIANAASSVTAATGSYYWAQGFKSKSGSALCATGYYVGAGSQCTSCGTGVTSCGIYLQVSWPYTCAAGYTRTKGAISSTGTFTYPTCKANNSLYLAVSYIALAAMLVLALF
jgi:hypothetical protein